MKRSLLALALSLAPTFALAQEDGRWVIRQTNWDISHDVAFANFVKTMGRSSCNNVDDCIKSREANIYYGTDPLHRRFYSDCADFPFFLRAYFSWKNSLPFSYVNGVRSYDAIEREKNPPVPQPGEEIKPIDNRYSSLGNYAVSRRAIIPGNEAADFFKEMDRLQNTLSSAMLRVGPESTLNKVAYDFYSPDLRPGLIGPGTVMYDPNGHIAVVYEVLPDGRILYMDAHPDNSVTRGVFSAKFSRARPAMGAGFKNFRPQRLVGAEQNFFDGLYRGGRIQLASDQEVSALSSLVQYYGNTSPDPADWKKGTFSRNGRNMTFHEFVRSSIATEKLNPVTEFEMSLLELCDDFQERAESVDAATDKFMHQKPHPGVLPPNIFGSEGDWENYSTPGRDTRLRASFLDLQKNANDRYQQWLRNDLGDLSYKGTDLKKDFLRAFHKINIQCSVSYKSSTGKRVNLSYELAIRRLFRMSFDPYHCPELRWGATHPSELAACADDGQKRAWYDAEQRIRNHLSRDWSSASPITLEDLQGGRFGADGGNLDLSPRQWLEALPAKGAQ